MQVTRKRRAPTVRQTYNSAKQRRLETNEAAEALLLLPATPVHNTEPTAGPSTSDIQEMFTATPLNTVQDLISIGTMCKPETDNKQCQTEKQASSDIVKLSIQN